MRLGIGNQPSAGGAKSRSEDVRKRRTSRNEQRVSKATQRAAHPVRVRPVLVRGNAFGMPVHRKARTAPRRAFYVTMDRAAGTELRLPSLPMINPGWRIVSSLIAVAALVGIYSLWNSFFFRISSVDVMGLERISAEEVQDRLQLENLSIIEIDPVQVAQKIKTAYPDLLEVQVSVELPNFVTVQASERQPVLAWQQGDRLLWLDPDGVIFPARGEVALVTIQSQDAPPLETVLAGPADSAGADSETETAASAETEAGLELQRVSPVLLTAVQTLSEKLPPETQLAYTSENGLGWVEPNGCQVYIGTDLTNFEAKYDMYQTIAAELASRGERPYLVSVEHLNAPFYRLEP